jgi:hypothetical protein
MKYFLFAMLCLAFSSCDDGNIEASALTVDPSQLFTCDNTRPFPLYNITQNEVMILNLSQNLLGEDITVDIPKTATLNSGQLVYRSFSDNVNKTFFCAAVQPIDPVAQSEFVSTGGVASIETRANLNEAGDTISFTHTINLLNVNLAQDDKEIRIENLLYGFIEIPKAN